MAHLGSEESQRKAMTFSAVIPLIVGVGVLDDPPGSIAGKRLPLKLFIIHDSFHKTSPHVHI